MCGGVQGAREDLHQRNANGEVRVSGSIPNKRRNCVSTSDDADSSVHLPGRPETTAKRSERGRGKSIDYESQRSQAAQVGM